MGLLIIGIIIGAVGATVYWMRRVSKLQALGAVAKGIATQAKDAADSVRKA